MVQGFASIGAAGETYISVYLRRLQDHCAQRCIGLGHPLPSRAASCMILFFVSYCYALVILYLLRDGAIVCWRASGIDRLTVAVMQVSEASADSVMTSKRPRTQSLSASPIVLPSAKPLVPYDQLTNPARTSKMLADHIGFLFKQYGQTSTGIELLQQDVYERLAPVFQIASKDEALLQVGRNAAKMVADLPHNSPFRLPLLALLIPNMTNQQIHSTLCASVCTIHRSSAHLPQGKNIIRDTLQEKGISRVRASYPCVSKY